MKLLFEAETYKEPIDEDAPVTDVDKWPRVAALSWVILNDDNRIVRGFRFVIKHSIGQTGFPEDVEHFHADQGHPAKYVIDRFLQDYDSSDVLISHGLKKNFGVLAAEAIRYGSRAKTRIENRYCTRDGIEIIYPGEGRTLADLYFAVFGDYIDDDLTPTQKTNAYILAVAELSFRGVFSYWLRPGARAETEPEEGSTEEIYTSTID